MNCLFSHDCGLASEMVSKTMYAHCAHPNLIQRVLRLACIQKSLVLECQLIIAIM